MPKSLLDLSIVFILLLAGILCITFYPFKFCPSNGVEWLPEQQGLYFNGQGIAYTEAVFTANDFLPAKCVSVELWLKERADSENWGPREIFSFFDGEPSPSLMIGEWNNQLFLYSRLEKNEKEKWYQLFKPNKQLQRGRTHCVTVTFDKSAKAIYIDGKLIDKKKTVLLENYHGGFQGRILLGNSPYAAHGWMGEIRGVAVYNRTLDFLEVSRHNDMISKNGMHALRETPGLKVLYAFAEGSGNRAYNILGGPLWIYLPQQCIAFKETFFHRPDFNVRIGLGWFADFMLNIILFMPLGFFAATILCRLLNGSHALVFFIVPITCGLITLCIETAQLFIPGRFSSIIDVISNVAGAGIGALFALVGEAFFKSFFSQKKG
jgi:glycopeptide antibiotics resistance protein